MEKSLRLVVLVAFLAASAAAQVQPPARRPGGRGFPGAPGNGAPVNAGPRATDAPPIDLSGAWKGAFAEGTSVYFVDLTLESPGDRRTLKGELKYASIVTPIMGRGVRPMEGSWKLAGGVDPGTRAFEVAPEGPIAGPMTAVQRQGLSGVISVKRNELAGQLRSQYSPTAEGPFFVFTRAGDAPDRVDAVARLRRIAEHAAAAQGMTNASGGAAPPSPAALAQWAGRFDQEYGATAKAGLGAERNQVMALPLLSDATFKPVFGETYDAIEYPTLLKATQRLGNTNVGRGSNERPDPNFVRDYGSFIYVLAPTPSRVATIPAVRTIDAWEAEMLAHFADDPPIASTFDDLAATLTTVHERVAYAWPSDRKKTDELIEQLKTRLSGSGLSVNVDRAISTAVGLAGAKSLASWAKDNAAMLQLAPQAEREAAQKRIDAKQDELLQPLIQAETAKLASLGAGDAAVRAGAAWYKSLIAQYGFASTRPPFVQAVAQLAARRDPDLAAGVGQTLQRVASCTRIEEVDALLANDLSVPGDDRLKNYPQVAESAKQRKEKIREERLLSLFSADERTMMDRPGHIDPRKSFEHEPGPEEIRLAMLRGFAGGEGGMIDAHTARTVRRSDSPLMMPFPILISFSEPEVIRVEETEEFSGEFVCTFKSRMQMSIPPDNALANWDPAVRKGTEQMLQFANAFAAAAGNEPQSELLHLYESGWGIPRLRDASAAEAAVGRFFAPR